MRVSVRNIGVLLLAITIGGSFVTTARADRYSSTHYVIDASVANNFGGSNSSTSYKLTGSGGESIVGQGSNGSYMLAGGYVAQLQNSIQLSVQPSGLVAYYPLDEPSGSSANDYGADGYTASAQSTPTWVTGKLGGALGYVTTTQYLKTTETAAFNTPYVTACAWVYKTATSTNPAIVTHTDNLLTTDGMWHLGYNNGQKPRFVIRKNAADNLIVAPSTVSLNQWHHICGTYDGSNMHLYVDAVDVVSLPLTGALPSVTQPLTIGARSGGTQVADTQYIDHVKVFNRALSADEITAEYDGSNTGNSAGVSLGAVVPGTSNTVLYDAVIQTDSYGYDLSVNQNQNLTSGADNIAGVSGTIASPATWTEGTTKGLGFTLVSTNATAIPGKWSSGNAYAAFPGTSTTFYTRTGRPSTRDILTMRLRLDVNPSQPTGTYSNVITTTGTIIP